MKKLRLLFPVVVAAALCGCGESESSRTQRERIATLEDDKVQMQLDYEDLREYLAVIADGLDSIRLEERELLLSNPAGEGQGWNRQRMKQNLDHVRLTLGRHRERIAELEAKLAGSNGALSDLRTIVESLHRQLDDKDRELEQLRRDLDDNRKNIASLTSQVEQMTEEQTELNQTIETQQETIDRQSEELSTGYIKTGSRKTLEKAGLLKGGGFLRSKKLDVSAIDLSEFDRIDTRTFTTLELPRKAKILTDIPADSYTLTDNGNGKTLVINNQARFWSVTNILIIQTD